MPNLKFALRTLFKTPLVTIVAIVALALYWADLFGRVMVVLGGAIGLASAIGLGPLAQSLLYELQGSDPLVLAAAAVSFSLVAFAAGFIPADGALGVDPMSALRYQ